MKSLETLYRLPPRPQCNLIHIDFYFLFQWAHFPNIHFGLGPYESSNKLDEAIGATGHPQKVQDLY